MVESKSKLFEKKKRKEVPTITRIDGEGTYTDIDSNPYEDYGKKLKKKRK